MARIIPNFIEVTSYNNFVPTSTIKETPETILFNINMIEEVGRLNAESAYLIAANHTYKLKESYEEVKELILQSSFNDCNVRIE